MSCRLPVPSPRVIARFLCMWISGSASRVELLIYLPNKVHAPDADDSHGHSALDVLQPMRCQLYFSPAGFDATHQLLQLPNAVPRRWSSSIVSRQPLKLAKYEPTTMAGLKWLGTTSPAI